MTKPLFLTSASVVRASLIRVSLLIASVLIAGARLAAQTPPIDASKARQYFAEAKALSDRDNSALWKVPLCGPLLFVDHGTRYAVANQADAEGKLKPLDGVFAGTAPEELGVANTATKWAGVELAAPSVQTAAYAIDVARMLSSRARPNRLATD